MIAMANSRPKNQAFKSPCVLTSTNQVLLAQKAWISQGERQAQLSPVVVRAKLHVIGLRLGLQLVLNEAVKTLG